MPRGWKGWYPLPPGGVLGIDPGSSSGGIGYVVEGYARGWKLPKTDRDIWDLIYRLSRVSQFAVLEKVHSMPKQGVSGVFKFGENYGLLRMATIAAGIPYELTPPGVWQGKLKCKTGGDKNVTKTRAQELWPQLKITHFIADALLMAQYGRRFVCDGSSG